MNSSIDSFCKSSVPWWVSFVLPPGLFLFGFIIIGFIHLKIIAQRAMVKKQWKRSAMMIRKRRLQLFRGSNGSWNKTFAFEEDKETKKNYLPCKTIFEIIVGKSSTIGRTLSMVQLTFHLISWSFYVYFTFFQIGLHYVIGDCYDPSSIWIQWTDFGLNIFCAVHFILRVSTANDIIKFWLLPSTMIDLCVIPNILLTSFLNVRRQGFSFLRIFYINEFCETFIITFGLLKYMKNNFATFKIILNFCRLWMIGGGVFHMIENIGNFWTYPTENQSLTLLSSMEFYLVTVVTVGTGYTWPLTILGQLLTCIFMLHGLTLCVNLLPATIQTIRNRNQNIVSDANKYESNIIVFGKFDNSNLILFLKTFMTRGYRERTRNQRIVIFNNQPCDEKLSIFLKTFIYPIKYISGNFVNQKDIKKICVRKSKVAIILSLSFTKEIHEDDINNIVIAMSMKRHCKNLRMIVQLHLYSNKILLKMCSKWNRNDIILCLNELKLSLMAYNCLTPGLSTLITNMMTRTKVKEATELWRRHYEYGLQVRLFNVQFSDDFHGMPCSKAALILYELWDICLLAIKRAHSEKEDEIVINPMSDNCTIDTNSMIAIVMARDEVAVSRVPFYCSQCTQQKPLKICQCFMNPSRNISCQISTKNLQFHTERSYDISEFEFPSATCLEENKKARFDETGSFHWSPEPKFEDICLNAEEAENRKISDHILVCICGSGKEVIDLCNFLMPLRSRSLSSSKLRTVVFLGEKNYFEGSRWVNIKNFPMILIINGSPLKLRDLKAAGLQQCHSCIILNGGDYSEKSIDKTPILCVNIIQYFMKSQNLRIPIIMEIRNDEIAYLLSSYKSQSSDIGISVQHTEPFASGLIFPNSIFYRCICSVYHNPHTFSFIKTLISGSESYKVEKMFGSGFGLLPEKTLSTSQHYSGVMIQLLPVSAHPLSILTNLCGGTYTYETLYKWTLEEKKILCLGIYRLKYGETRYVFTHPKKSTEIYLTDLIYCCISTSSDYL